MTTRLIRVATIRTTVATLTFGAALMFFGCSKGAAKKEPEKASPAAKKAPTPAPAEQPSAEPEAPAKPSAASLEKIQVLGGTAHVPAGWVAQKPSSPMRLAQIKLPRQGSDTRDGVLTLISAGGTVQANIDRWASQFQGGVTPKVTDLKMSGGQVAQRVEIAGTFMHKARPMMPGPGTPLPNTTLLGAIVDTPRGQLFVKATGPTATMKRWTPEFDGFVATMSFAVQEGADGGGG